MYKIIQIFQFHFHSFYYHEKKNINALVKEGFIEKKILLDSYKKNLKELVKENRYIRVEI